MLKEHYGYITPLKENIKCLLNMPEIWEFVNNNHCSGDGLTRNLCDGSFIKNSPLFQKNRNALQILVNHDYLEIVNTLSFHSQKHKVSIFISLANIPPCYRTKWISTDLVGIAKVQYFKTFSLHFFRKDFVDAIHGL